MRFTLRKPRDLWCGILFVGFGALAIYAARGYTLGSALEMGPGYFPTWLGGIMAGFGLVIGALAFGRVKDEPSPQREPWSYRPWLVLTAALAAFAKLMDAGFGFVPSVVVLIIGCALAHRDVRCLETALLSVFLTVAVVLVFSYGLDLPYRLFWWSE